VSALLNLVTNEAGKSYGLPVCEDHAVKPIIVLVHQKSFLALISLNKITNYPANIPCILTLITDPFGTEARLNVI
jgi:hypothetical protein